MAVCVSWVGLAAVFFILEGDRRTSTSHTHTKAGNATTLAALVPTAKMDTTPTIVQDCFDSDEASTFHPQAKVSDKTSDTKVIAAGVLDYYNSDNVFDFYYKVQGGEHIHIGLYSMLEGEDAKLEGAPRISKAGYLCTRELLSLCFSGSGSLPPDQSTLVDLGSGFGGTARIAAKEIGCKVICINIVKRENELNAALSMAAGLGDKVIIPGETSFFDTGLPDSICDVICSQDALLHGGSEIPKALEEAARILKPGGRMVVSDILRSEEADPTELKKVYDRCGLVNMGTLKNYLEWGQMHGLELVKYNDQTDNLVHHYESVREVLLSLRGGPEGLKEEFVDKMAEGLNDWTSAGRRRLICWGFMVLQKSAVSV